MSKECARNNFHILKLTRLTFHVISNSTTWSIYHKCYSYFVRIPKFYLHIPKIFSMLCILMCSISYALTWDQVNMVIVQSGEALNANFVQARHFVGLPKPIISKGTIEIWGDKGLIWHTKRPFPSIIIISENGIYQKDITNDQPFNKITPIASGAGIFKAVSNILKGSFTTNKAQDFDVEILPVSTTDKWYVKLTPNRAPINKIINAIDVIGDQYIKQITIYRPNGDYDVISLDSHIISAVKNKTWQYD